MYLSLWNSSNSSSLSNNSDITCKLSDKQKNKLTAWLERYRNLYEKWWNYLPNTVIHEITTNIPLTIEDLAQLEGNIMLYLYFIFFEIIIIVISI